MIQRFQIEDLVVQDSSGVVFRALDTETNQIVAVRRFFPFGASGGGLREDEQIAYSIAVEHLAAISHPALRAVISGGCDPVDGVPYIATEWIEGSRLETFIERRSLDPLEATSLLSKALEVCEILSKVLAEEAVWVETSLQAIVVGAEGSGRGVTFWIAPLKWLGYDDGQPGLDSIITLTQEIMGWSGKTVADHEGQGLGGWLNWLRDNARTATLQEVRGMLVASVGVEPPVPVTKPVRQASRQRVVTRKKKASRWPIFTPAVVILIALALGGYWLIKRNDAANVAWPVRPSPEMLVTAQAQATESLTPPEVSASATYRTGERGIEQVNREAAALTANQQKLEQAKSARRDQIEKAGNRFEVMDRELLLEKKNVEVQLVGRLAEVQFSNNGKGGTLYLEFSRPAAKDEPRGYILRKDLTAEINLESLQKFIGKNVTLRGTVNTPNSKQRPEIAIRNLAAIQEVP